MAKFKLEYIWLDGNKPTQELRSKTKVVDRGELKHVPRAEDLPEWSFDGSSTGQATGEDSDCILKPVRVVKDPIRNDNCSFLVLCEVLNTDGTPHPTNTRAELVKVAKKYQSEEMWFGIEQEYFMLDQNNIALGWPGGNHVPKQQGHYYCGIGADRVFGREVSEAHLDACLKAGIDICGTNVEVAPGQHEYQVGPLDPVSMADQLWLSRYLLNRIGEKQGVIIALDPKPYRGDWNGSGAHTNLSTKLMRENGGIKHIEIACKKLAKKHKLHMDNYGAGNDKRMTGEFETSNYDTFTYSIDSNRGQSVRVPVGVRKAGKGYMEDRRPSSNCDPNVVCRLLMETICEKE